MRRTLNDSGAPTGLVFYDPWGTPESGAVPTFGFTGEPHDPATGLVNLRARWYSTAKGTFTSKDPFEGFPEQPYSLHPYQYGYSDPVLNTDPTGRCRTIARVKYGEVIGKRIPAIECEPYIAILYNHGIEVDNPDTWELIALRIAAQGVSDLRSAAGWTHSQFKFAMSGNGRYRVIFRRIHEDHRADNFTALTGPPQGNIIPIRFFDYSIGDKDPGLANVVHELGHVWDQAAGYLLSEGFVDMTGGFVCLGRYFPGGEPLDTHAAGAPGEDWGLSVAATVYSQALDPSREAYVRAAFEWVKEGHLGMPPLERFFRFAIMLR